ncbi:MAG: hypothetical protein EB088_13260 [Betaproteobacteria bacterium]|nr:hypothetical protein [Betaproteobacteria bacterium]
MLRQAKLYGHGSFIPLVFLSDLSHLVTQVSQSLLREIFQKRFQAKKMMKTTIILTATKEKLSIQGAIKTPESELQKSNLK